VRNVTGKYQVIKIVHCRRLSEKDVGVDVETGKTLSVCAQIENDIAM
jgi:hypothetical protein